MWREKEVESKCLLIWHLFKNSFIKVYLYTIPYSYIVKVAHCNYIVKCFPVIYRVVH